MAFIINTASADRIGKTGGFTSSTNKTVMVHCKTVASTWDGAYLRTGDGSSFAGMYYSDGSSVWAHDSSSLSAGRDNDLAITANEWVVLALRDNAGTHTCHVGRYSGGSWTWTQIRSGTQPAYTFNDVYAGYSSRTLGSFRNNCPSGTKFAYFRYWNAYLDNTALASEAVNSVAQRSADLVFDASLESGAGALTATGGSFGTDVPSYIGSGSSIAPKAAYYSMLRRA